MSDNDRDNYTDNESGKRKTDVFQESNTII